MIPLFPLWKWPEEPAATNGPVGLSVQWMGCVFSFGFGWVAFFHLLSGGVHCSRFLFFWLTSVLFLFFSVLGPFSPGPDLAHSNPTRLPTLISNTLTLLPYLLSLTDIATLITSPTDLVTILTIHPINYIRY